MATSDFQVTAVQSAWTPATAGETSASVYVQMADLVQFKFAAALPAASATGPNLPAGWSNFATISGANLYVRAIKDPQLVSGVRS